MSRIEEITKLQRLAELMLDHRLAALREAASAKAQSEATLAGLSAPEAVEGLQGAAGALAALQYQRWAEARRTELNACLARQTRAWLDARDLAKEAFGKAEALRGLVRKLG